MIFIFLNYSLLAEAISAAMHYPSSSVYDVYRLAGIRERLCRIPDGKDTDGEFLLQPSRYNTPSLPTKRLPERSQTFRQKKTHPHPGPTHTSSTVTRTAFPREPEMCWTFPTLRTGIELQRVVFVTQLSLVGYTSRPPC